jgi:hypothetical protein
VALLTLLFVLEAFELTLRSGVFDRRDHPNPVWKPRKFRDISIKFNDEHLIRGRDTWNGFNDLTDFITREDGRLVFSEKPSGSRRIVVLGDSVEWGHGLPFESIWVNKLERKIAEAGHRASVSNWSYVGWEGIDHFLHLVRFMEYCRARGIEPEIDLVVIGFTSNDPSFGFERPKKLQWQDSPLLAPARAVIPNVVDFLGAYINTFLYEYVLHDYGRKNYKEMIYSADNMVVYSRLLEDLSAYCRMHGIPMMFMIINSTPYSEKVIRLFNNAGIEYLDVYPAMTKRLEGINPRKLWANLGDSHPGDPVTEVFADEVLSYMERTDFFTEGYPDLKIKRQDPALERAILGRLASLQSRRAWWNVPTWDSLLDFDIMSVLEEPAGVH